MTKTFHFVPNCSILTVDNLRLGHKLSALSNYLSARRLFLKIMRSVPVEFIGRTDAKMIPLASCRKSV